MDNDIIKFIVGALVAVVVFVSIKVIVEYFQRKGTAAIMLYWQPPGSSDLSIIPAKAYGHIP